ncbi:hypothetical protein TNCV_4080211 [Trichonephila clavipes]|nr:hypothetical protein TNCV_4080211 [Trichonephila clavipes]
MRQRNCHHRHTKRNLLADPLKETFTENTYQNRDTDTDNHINNTVNTFISTYPTTYLDPVLPDEIITYIKKSSSKKAPAIILTFQQPIGRLALPVRFLTENFPRCQDPCLEAPPTGLPPLVQLQ